MRGSIAGRDTLIFDHRTSSGPDYQPRGEIMVDQTVVGFRVPPDTYCRDRGVLQSDDLAWRVEKVGEWIFVFQGYVRVKPADIEAFVEQARSLYQTAIDPGAFQLTARGPVQPVLSINAQSPEGNSIARFWRRFLRGYII